MAPRTRLARVVVGIAWAGVLAFVSAQVLAAAWRADPTHSGSIESWVTFGTLLIQTFTFHAGIALAGLCLVALAVRKKRLAAAVALLVALTLGPAAWTSVSRGDGRGPGDLVVMSANVLYHNDDPARFVDEVRRIGPDIVLVQEYRASWSAELHGALGDAYPYAVEAPMVGAGGQAVFSRRPFLATPVLVPGVGGFGRPQIRVAVEHGGERVEVVCVHLTAPLSWRAVGMQRREVGWVAELVEGRMGADDAPAAVIVGGDFNAPYRSNHLRELRAAGLGEAHEDAGAGHGASWKPRRRWLAWAPGVRIDQLMHRGRVRCTGAGVGGDVGSDHRPIWASFGVE